MPIRKLPYALPRIDNERAMDVALERLATFSVVGAKIVLTPNPKTDPNAVTLLKKSVSALNNLIARGIIKKEEVG